MPPSDADPPPPLWKRVALRFFFLPTLALAAGVALRLALTPVLGDKAPVLTFVPAVVLAAFGGGLVPGLITTVCAAALALHFFVPPVGLFAAHGADDLTLMGLFLLVGAAVSALGEWGVRGRRSAADRAAELARERGTLAATLTHIGDGVITAGADRRVVFLNAEAERLTGWPLAEAQGRPLGEIFALTETSPGRKLPAPLGAVAAGEAAVRDLGALLRGRDGETLYVDATTALLPGNGGVVVSFRDVTERRKADRELRDARLRLEAALEAGTIATWAWDVRRDAVAPDRNLARLFLGDGAGPGERPLRAFTDAIHPDDRERVKATIGAALADGDRYECDFRLVSPSAGERSVVARGRVLRAPDGTADAMPGVVIDVTERAAAEAALHASEQRRLAVLESISDSFFALDRDWRFTYVNRRGEQVLGREPGELLGRVIWDDYPGLAGSDFEKLYRRAGAGEPGSVTAYYPDHGRWYEVHAYPAPDGISVFFRDVTRRQQAEVERREREALIRLALEVAELGVFEWYPAGGPVLWHNRRMYDLFGRDPDAGPYSVDDFRAVADPADYAAWEAAVAAALAGPGRYACTVRVRRTDGEERFLDVTGRVGPGADGAPGRVLGMIRDVTDAKRAELALRASEERYRTLFTTMDEGFSVVEMLYGPPDDYRFLEMNPAFEKHTGLSGALGRTARETMPGLEPFWFEMYGRVARTGEPVRFEHAAEVLGGRWFDVYAFRLGANGSRKVAILFRDVTDQRRADKRIAELLARVEQQARVFDSVLSSIQDVVYLFEPDGRFSYANKRLLDIWGLTLDQAFGKTMADLDYPPEVERALTANLREVFATGRPVQSLTDYTNPRGERGFYDNLLSPVFDAAGRVVQVAGTSRDVTEQRRAEEALRDSEAELRRITDSMPQIVYVSGPDGETVFINRRWEEITGVPLDGPGVVASLVHPDDLPGLLAAFDRARAERRVAEAEFRLKTRLGYRWFLTRAVPVYGEGGELLRMYGTSTDVDAAKRTRDELRASEARFQGIIDASPDVLYLFDLRRRVNLFVSRQSEAVLGLSPDELIRLGPEAVARVVHPDDLERLATSEAEFDALPPGGVLEREYRVVREGGGVRLVRSREVVYSRSADGRAELILGLANDITERRENERELARLLGRERRLTETLTRVAEASLAVQSAGTAEAALRAATEKAREIVGAERGFARFEPPEALEALAVDVPEGAGPPPGAGIAAPLLARDGTPVGSVALAGGDFGPDDAAVLSQLANVAGVAAENARLTERLREQDRRKDEFLATLAHELRNPLAPVRTGLQVLKLTSDPAQVARARETMERQMGHMVRLIDDLMDVSRITRGKLTLRPARMDLRLAVESAVEASRPAVERGRHELTVELPAGPLPVEGDLTRLAQVFMNLLTNAAKYTPDGGRIALAARADGPEAVVEVRDSGTGIPAEALPTVFDMFTQVDRTLHRAQGGLGIGLTLVRRLAELHGGRADAASDGPGRGSAFTVRLPLAAE